MCIVFYVLLLSLQEIGPWAPSNPRSLWLPPYEPLAPSPPLPPLAPSPPPPLPMYSPPSSPRPHVGAPETIARTPMPPGSYGVIWPQGPNDATIMAASSTSAPLS